MPYLLDIPEKGDKVKGEVYAVDDALLADLDHMEKVGSVNKRRIAKVCSCSDRSFVAQAYVYFANESLQHRSLSSSRHGGNLYSPRGASRYTKTTKSTAAYGSSGR